MTGRKFNFDTELDEMHRAVLSVLPEKLLDLTDISVTRAGLDALMGQMPAPETPENILIKDINVPGLNGDLYSEGTSFRSTWAVVNSWGRNGFRIN